MRDRLEHGAKRGVSRRRGEAERGECGDRRVGHHRAPDTDRDDDEQAEGPRVRIAHTRNKACNRGARIAQEPRVVLGSLRNKRPGLSGRPPCKAIFEGILWCLESKSVLQNAINWRPRTHGHISELPISRLLSREPGTVI